MFDIKIYYTAIDIIFTKWHVQDNDEEDRNKVRVEEIIKNQVTQALTEMKRESEEKFGNAITMCEHIITLYKEKRIIVLNPIGMGEQKERKRIIELLFADRRRSPDFSMIRRPQEEFKTFVTESSLNSIKLQCQKHKSSIRKLYCFERKERKNSIKVTYDLIELKLHELRELKRILPDVPYINETLKECVFLVSKEWNHKCNDLITRLQRCSKSDNTDDNELNDVLESYKMIIEEYTDLNNLFLVKNNNNNENESKLEAKMDEETKIANQGNDDIVRSRMNVMQLKSELNKEFRSILDKCHLTRESGSNFEKIKIYLGYFSSEFNELYTMKMEKISTELNKLYNSTKACIESYNFESVLKNIQLLDSLHYLNSHLSNTKTNIHELSKNLKMHLEDQLGAHLKNITSTFEMNTSKNNNNYNNSNQLYLKYEETVRDCENSYKILQSAKNVFDNPTKGIDATTVWNNANIAMIAYCNAIASHVIDILTGIVECSNPYFTPTPRLNSMRSNSIHSMHSIHSIHSFSSINGNSQIMQQAQETSLQKMENIQKYAAQLIDIREIDECIARETAKHYFRMIQKIFGYVFQFRTSFESKLYNIETKYILKDEIDRNMFNTFDSDNDDNKEQMIDLNDNKEAQNEYDQLIECFE